MEVGVFWRKFRNVEQQMMISNDNIYDDAYEEALHHRDALKGAGYDVCMVEWTNDPLNTLEDIKNKRIDIIFNASSNKEITFLETFDIPYVGSGIDLVYLDKAIRKQLVAYNSLPTAKFVVVKDVNKIPEINFNYPIFVKPISGRGSAGITEDNIVYKYEDLPKEINKIINNIGQAALIEEFIEGREITVGIVGYKDPVVLPIIEIEYNSLKTNTFEHKMLDKETIYCPAKFSPEEEENIKNVALNIYKILNAKDFARIDMIVGKDGVPYFLELNTFAGLTTESKKDENGKVEMHQGYMGISAKTAEMTASQFLGKILDSALERYNIK